MSLVEVLPALPVTATTLASERRRTAAAEAPQGALAVVDHDARRRRPAGPPPPAPRRRRRPRRRRARPPRSRRRRSVSPRRPTNRSPGAAVAAVGARRRPRPASRVAGLEAAAAGGRRISAQRQRQHRRVAGPRDAAAAASELLCGDLAVVEVDRRRARGSGRCSCPLPAITSGVAGPRLAQRQRGWPRAGRARPRRASRASGGTPARISSMIASGSSLRGLSEVTHGEVGELGARRRPSAAACRGRGRRRSRRR